MRDRRHARASRSRTPADLDDPSVFERRARRRRDRRHVDADRGPARRRRAHLRDRRHARAARPRLPSSPSEALDRGRRPRPAGRTSLPACSPVRRRRRGLITVAATVRRPPGRRHRRAPQRRQEHAVQPRRRRRRAAIVEDRARTTRDRLYGDAEWNGRRFVVVDTGGLEVDPGDPIEEQVQDQARLAINEADVIVFLVDAATGLTPADQEAAETAAPRRRSRCWSPSTRPTTRSASSTPRSSSRFGWEDTFADLAPTTGAAPATCSTRSSGRCRRRASRRSPARRARTRPRHGPKEMARAKLDAVRRRRSRERRGRGRRGRRCRGDAGSADAPGSIGDVSNAGTRRWPPTTTSPPRSRSSAGPTSASRACSTRCWATTG